MADEKSEFQPMWIGDAVVNLREVLAIVREDDGRASVFFRNDKGVLLPLPEGATLKESLGLDGGRVPRELVIETILEDYRSNGRIRQLLKQDAPSEWREP